MNLSLFIARRLGNNTTQSFSTIVTRIAIAGIAIGVAIILVAFGILLGFQDNIRQKLFSLNGHIHVTQRSIQQSYQETPLSINTDLFRDYHQIPAVKHLQVYAQKPGILKTPEEVLGVVVKGIGKDFDRKGFQANMKKGDFVRTNAESGTNDIVISQKIADKLKLNVKDSVIMFFVQNPPRFRKVYVRGIYQTGMEEFDDKIIYGDIRLIQKLNGWADTLVGGYEIFVKNFEELDSIAVYQVLEKATYEMNLESISETFMPVFDWLQLLNKNVTIFLGLILLVAAFNIISILLIMIMERVQMIGILKAIGATNRQVRRVFIFKGMLLILQGMTWGNVTGLGFCALQYYFRLIPLDAENYYMDTVPIAWDIGVILSVNALIFTIISLVLLLPTIAATRIRPIQAIRFD